MAGEAIPERRFEEFIRDYGERAFQFAFRLSGSVDEARELVQESFYRVLRHWDAVDQARSLDGIYFKILRNLFNDGRRRYSARNVVSLDAAPQGHGEESTFADILPDQEGALLEALERRSESEAVHQAIAALSVEHRAVLVLCDIEGRGYDYIAESLDLPLGTVRSRISRARLAFRRALAAALEVL